MPHWKERAQSSLPWVHGGGKKLASSPGTQWWQVWHMEHMSDEDRASGNLPTATLVRNTFYILSTLHVCTQPPAETGSWTDTLNPCHICVHCWKQASLLHSRRFSYLACRMSSCTGHGPVVHHNETVTADSKGLVKGCEFMTPRYSDPFWRMAFYRRGVYNNLNLGNIKG